MLVVEKIRAWEGDGEREKGGESMMKEVLGNGNGNIAPIKEAASLCRHAWPTV